MPSANAITEPLQSPAPRPRTTSPSSAGFPRPRRRHGVDVGREQQRRAIGPPDQQVVGGAVDGQAATGRPHVAHRASRWSTASCSVSDGERDRDEVDQLPRGPRAGVGVVHADGERLGDRLVEDAEHGRQ